MDTPERNLATVTRVLEIRPIEGADAIECARIRGWEVVVRKGEFSVGDACVYFEVDSMLDVDRPEFAFLAPRGVRTDAVTGQSGHVLKTVKLRGQVSQGLALPLSAIPDVSRALDGDDVTVALGVAKWDPPLPASLAGSARGYLPSWIRKSDQERLQNIPEVLADDGSVGFRMSKWIPTEKIDGTSCTIYVERRDDEGEPSLSGEMGHGVCSRNLDLTESEGNALWSLAREHDLHARLAEVCVSRGYVQGEVFGEGVQGNPLKVRGRQLALFAVCVDGVVLRRHEWPAWASVLSVPSFPLPFPGGVAEALEQASVLRSGVPGAEGQRVEGIVWQRAGSGEPASFKVISNRYLMKHDR